MTEKLYTQRLVLRPFLPEDWQDLYEYLSDAEVVKFEPYAPMTEEECRTQAVERAGNAAFIAVCLAESGKVIGNLYFQQEEPRTWRMWELGYVFNRAYWGKGYATEAAAALLQYAFGKLGARRVIAMCNPLNTPSWRLMERLGMRRESHMLQNGSFWNDEHGDPIFFDTYQYAMLAQEWKKPHK